MQKYQGHSQILLRPKTTQQVSEILQHCNSRNLAVVPQGGNTGLVGGGVPVYDEVIVNLGAMNKIISFDEVSGILVCEAGCILESLDNFIKSEGFTMTLDLDAKGSCQIWRQRVYQRKVAYGCCDMVLFMETSSNVLKEAKLQLGEILSDFEFMDRPALDMALTHLSGTRDPLPQSWKKFYLLVETTGSNESHDKEKLNAFLESTMEKGLVVDGVVAQGSTQAASFWQIRKGISEALGKAGAVYKYDFSLPPEYFYKIVEDVRDRLGSAGVVVGYSHLGDGNIHLNVST